MFSFPYKKAAIQKLKKNRSSFSIFQKATLAITLITLLVSLTLVWLSFTVKEKVIGIEQQWHTYSHNAAHISHVLNRIQTNFGYGGFIHNFNKYILSKDPSHIPNINKNLSEIRRAINEYPLHGIFKDHDDGIYLNALSQVVDQYADNFKLTKQLIAEGMSSNEINQKVAVNDAPAFKAIKHLSDHVTERNDKISIETSKRLDNTLNFINWTFLLIPFVILCGIYMLLLFKKIKETNYRLEESWIFLSDLFEAAPDAVLVVDEKGVINEANQRAENIFGISKKSLVGSNVESLIPQRFREQHKIQRNNSFFSNKKRELMKNLDLYALGKDNVEIPVSISLSYTTRNEKKYAIVIVRDITEQKRIEERIHYLAQYDQLTKLPNRALFNDRLQHSIDRAQRNSIKVALIFLDLDGFKNVNDSLGHQAGDELLQIIAERLLNITRTEDTVARYGGDEFTIILEEPELTEHVAVAAKKVLQAIGEVIYLSGHEVTVGASIGISIYPDNGTDIDKLIKNADTAMYQSKKQGKNCYQFYLADK